MCGKKKKQKAEGSDDSTPSMSSVNAPHKRPKKTDFWNIIPISVSITESIQSDHIAELQKEFQKAPTKQDKTKVRELMNLTYELLPYLLGK